MRLDECGRARDHVIAVVQQDQRAAIAQLIGERLDQRSAGCLPDAEDGRHRPGQRSLADRRQIDEPHAVGKQVDRLTCDLHRQPRLAAPAGPRQRQQPCVWQQPDELGDLLLAPDEAGERRRQVVRR